jgi:hypothetical protein
LRCRNLQRANGMDSPESTLGLALA